MKSIKGRIIVSNRAELLLESSNDDTNNECNDNMDLPSSASRGTKRKAGERKWGKNKKNITEPDRFEQTILDVLSKEQTEKNLTEIDYFQTSG